MSWKDENDLACAVHGARIWMDQAAKIDAPKSALMMALGLLIRAVELMFARLAKLEDRLLGPAQTTGSKATERADSMVKPGQTAYEAWRNLPSTFQSYTITKRWEQLSAIEADEWESIAAAVVDKHGREQAPTNAGTFDEPLVDKLARAYIDYRKQDSRWDKMSEADKSDVRYEMRIILGELQKMPCELPTAKEISDAQFPKLGIDTPMASELVRSMLRAKLAPILAAKDARIAELEARDFEAGELLAKTHVAHVEATARLGALEKRHAELLAAAQVALEHWGSDDAEHEAAAMTELQRLVDEVA